MIVAGEASADLHGSNLVRAIRKLDPHITFSGIGGRKMEDAGVRILASSSDMAVVGLTEVLSRLRVITGAYLKLRSLLKHFRPDLLILIDYPDFNLALAKVAKRFSVPVLYYISPQVWAWRQGRAKKLADRVDRMAVILPFEEDFYRRKGLNVEYVGHPLLDAVPQHLPKDDALKELGFDTTFPILGLLPGSRKEEIKNLLPAMVRGAEIVSSQYPDLKCVLPLAPSVSRQLVESITGQSSLEVTIFEGNIYKVLKACDVALVTSGTATLETALMGVPMVIAYRVSPISYWIGRRVVKVPYIGLVNLVAGESIAPELIQRDVTPERLAREALALLQAGQDRENMIKKMGALRQGMGRGRSSERTAKIALDMIGH
ncbi:MAG: lipid-A-disaccharide synthase [Deltaproteobacteria bacterium]